MRIRFSLLHSLPPNLGFRKSSRLKTDEISSVFSFKHQENGEFLRVLYKPNPPQVARLAVVIGRKISRLAVERNYCKRVVRELFRTSQYRIGSLELVILVRKKFSRCQFAQVAREFEVLVSKIIQRC